MTAAAVPSLAARRDSAWGGLCRIWPARHGYSCPLRHCAHRWAHPWSQSHAWSVWSEGPFERPGRANGQSSSAALRTCAPAARTPAVRVVHANPGHLASSRGEPRLASPARAPAATALPVGPETCSAGPERRGRCAPRRRAGRPPAAVRLAVGVAGTRSFARPHRGSGTAPRGQDLVALAGGARRGRTRPTRTRRLPPPRMPVAPRFLCSLRFVCTLGGHRRCQNPAGAPNRSHDAFCRARCPRAHHPGRSTRTHAPTHAPTRPTVHPVAPRPPP